jgi:hypothetical protein
MFQTIRALSQASKSAGKASITLSLASIKAAVEDPIKRLFLEKIKDYQKAKPKNDNIKRVVATIKQTLEASK